MALLTLASSAWTVQAAAGLPGNVLQLWCCDMQHELLMMWFEAYWYLQVFKHKHEIESGRTSSLSQQLLGYAADGVHPACGKPQPLTCFPPFQGHLQCPLQCPPCPQALTAAA